MRRRVGKPLANARIGLSSPQGLGEDGLAASATGAFSLSQEDFAIQAGQIIVRIELFRVQLCHRVQFTGDGFSFSQQFGNLIGFRDVIPLLRKLVTGRKLLLFSSGARRLSSDMGDAGAPFPFWQTR
jgi:hypothetical protein